MRASGFEQYQSPGKCRGCNPSQERLRLIILLVYWPKLNSADCEFRQVNQAEGLYQRIEG